MQTPKFPFAAVAGQAEFKLALILAAINPAIGGVLVSGPRGSAKSTLARGLADVMPGNHQFVTLPLGASEDMLVGTLDLQKVLDKQEVDFHPGLLAKANGGVLYVDEVNLLPDTLVDLLLDVAASGVNCVERDGISHSHESKFLLLGTMNPDEGELRPQLQDRFGLAVELNNQYSLEERIDIVRLREAFDNNPQIFIADYVEQQQAIADRIKLARGLLSQVICPDDLRTLIAERCHAAQVDGLRADIVWCRAAMAHAAWQQRKEVLEEDVLAVEDLVLNHRRSPPSSSRQPPSSRPFSRPPESRDRQQQEAGDWGSMEPVQQKTAAQHSWDISQVLQQPEQKFLKIFNNDAAKNKGVDGGYYQQDKKNSTKPNWFTTLVGNMGQWPPQKLFFRRAKSGRAVLHLVLLDTSASTLQHNQFAQAKAAILNIADRAYLKREQLAILGFGNQQVETLLPCVRAPKALRQLLDNIPAAGGTPLREVLQYAYHYQQQLLARIPGLVIHNYLMTDGKTTQSFTDLPLLGNSVVIDIEQSPVKRGKGKIIAQQLHADYLPLPV